MKIENENYLLDYNEETHHIKLSGSLRLNGLDEYAPVLNALKQCMQSTNNMQINLSQLEFLNSSGIAMLAKFVIEARSQENFILNISGSNQIPWQEKSLKNLQRLFPALEVTIN